MNIERDTVGIDESVHEIYRKLTDGNDPINTPFRTMKDVFLLAACFGYKNNTRRKIENKKIIIFRWAQFGIQIDIPIIKAIALASKGDLSVLLNQEEILEIIEEYANGGIVMLQDLVSGNYGQPLLCLEGLIQE